MSHPLSPEEGVAFRDFLSKIKQDRFRTLMREGVPAPITAEDILKADANGIARIAAMNAGFEAAVDYFFTLAQTKRQVTIDSGHQDMS